MCLSPDQMSDARIQEAIDYYQEIAEQCRLEGDVRDERYYLAKVDDFQALLDERRAGLEADLAEIAAPVLTEVAAERETVSV